MHRGSGAGSTGASASGITRRWACTWRGRMNYSMRSSGQRITMGRSEKRNAGKPFTIYIPTWAVLPSARQTCLWRIWIEYVHQSIPDHRNTPGRSVPPPRHLPGDRLLGWGTDEPDRVPGTGERLDRALCRSVPDPFRAAQLHGVREGRQRGWPAADVSQG